ncbi:MAG: ABC transporter ATP-binding protein [Propionibacteriaceae bacterium]|jgi:ABC-type glutathione transport system ATPase component|nr:ABC transporter ATP-binding protein [Propionibacteriaceae bacterium]
MTPLLEVSGLNLAFGQRRTPALRDVSFTLDGGQRLGIIGESGSGKSVTALAVMGLLPDNAFLSGSIRWRGQELVGLGDAAYSKLRGDDMTMVFQEPMTALDPTMPVGLQVAEVLRLHRARSKDAARFGASAEQIVDNARNRVLEMLTEVGLPDPGRAALKYPHQLSGGQRQRVMIAMALINRPALVICDEPTTALDVTVQAKVLRLIDYELRAVQAASLFISHDLAVVSQVCDEVLVLYHGEVVERGHVAQVLGAPEHPYTKGLVATARLDLVTPGERLPVIEDFLSSAQLAGGGAANG